MAVIHREAANPFRSADEIRREHAALAANASGQSGLPQGPCRCTVCAPPAISIDRRCPTCDFMSATPKRHNLPLDIPSQWSEVRWGHDDRSSQDFEVRRGHERHVFHKGAEFPICAPWWDTGIAPPDRPDEGKPLWRRPQLVERSPSFPPGPPSCAEGAPSTI